MGASGPVEYVMRSLLGATLGHTHINSTITSETARLLLLAPLSVQRFENLRVLT